jgi:hypothetical protein
MVLEVVLAYWLVWCMAAEGLWHPRIEECVSCAVRAVLSLKRRDTSGTQLLGCVLTAMVRLLHVLVVQWRASAMLLLRSRLPL